MTYGRLCDYLISTDSYVYAGVCVGGRSHRHDANSLKIGQHNRMSPTCWSDIVDMSATDKNVCRLRGGADRHKSRYCQPSLQVDHSWTLRTGWAAIEWHALSRSQRRSIHRTWGWNSYSTVDADRVALSVLGAWTRSLLDARGVGSWDKRNSRKAKFSWFLSHKLVAKKMLGPPW